MEPMGSYLPGKEIKLKGEISTGLLQGERDLCFAVVGTIFQDYTQSGDQGHY